MIPPGGRAQINWQLKSDGFICKRKVTNAYIKKHEIKSMAGNFWDA